MESLKCRVHQTALRGIPSLGADTAVVYVLLPRLKATPETLPPPPPPYGSFCCPRSVGPSNEACTRPLYKTSLQVIPNNSFGVCPFEMFPLGPSDVECTQPLSRSSPVAEAVSGLEVLSAHDLSAGHPQKPTCLCPFECFPP